MKEVESAVPCEGIGFDLSSILSKFPYQPSLPDLSLLEKRFTPEMYELIEEREEEHRSKWRGDHISTISHDPSFYKHLRSRYKHWLGLSSTALSVFEACLAETDFDTGDMIELRSSLLQLWAFLPTDLHPAGVPDELQWKQIERFRKLHPKVDTFERIDRCLEHMLDHLHKQPNVGEHLKLFKETGDLKKDDLVKSGAYKILLKRFLLQTPLLFWPSIFIPNAMKSEHLELLHRYPNEVMIVDNPFYIDVFCQNHNMWDGDGTEVLSVWNRDMLQHKRISDFGAARPLGCDRWSGDEKKRWCFRTLLAAAASDEAEEES